MPDIKPFSSSFATKLNYILDVIGSPPIQKGRMKAIENLTGEKEHNITNWLFSGKLPKLSKRLALADSLGVSYEYLYNDTIDITEFSKPEIHFENNVYLIPHIREENLFKLKNKEIYPVINRIPFMIPEMRLLIEKYGKNIYATNLNKSIIAPYIEEGSAVIYSENAQLGQLEDSSLVIHKDNEQGKMIIKRIIKEGNEFFIESLDKTQSNLQRSTLEEISEEDLLLIILTYKKASLI